MPLSIYDERVLPKWEMLDPLDVLIPLIEKDLHLLPHCIAALRKYLHHPIGKISIIAPPATALLAAPEEQQQREDAVREAERQRLARDAHVLEHEQHDLELQQQIGRASCRERV